jgi:hypothetical protein
MTIDEGRKPEGAPERCPKAGEGAPSGVGPSRILSEEREFQTIQQQQTFDVDLGPFQPSRCIIGSLREDTQILEGGHLSKKALRPTLSRKFSCHE